MRSRPSVAIAAVIPAGLLLLLMLTVLFVPDRAWKGVLVRGLQKEGYDFHAADFSKTFPLGIRIRGLTIGNSKGDLLKADDLVLRLEVLPLLAGKVTLAVDGRIGAGTFRGEVDPQQKGPIDFNILQVRLQDIPFFTTAIGATVQGELTGGLHFRPKEGKGELKLEIKGAELRGIKLGDLPLPDSSYRTVQGMVRASGGKIAIESFTLEGDGVYARLKGDLPLSSPLAASPLNLSLELMPKPDFMEKQKFIFLLLMKYQDAPGHYAVPIRGLLGKPSVF